MPVRISTLTDEDAAHSSVLHMSINGTLERSDYDQFVPEIEERIHPYVKIDLLLELSDFHGSSSGAMWEVTKFGIHHFNDIRKLAVIGDRQRELCLADFTKAFTTAGVRYFDISRYQEASKWLRRI